MIVDRVHLVAATVLTCGACKHEIGVDDAYGELHIAGVKRALTRCAACLQKIREDTAAHEAEAATRPRVVPFPGASSAA